MGQSAQQTIEPPSSARLVPYRFPQDSDEVTQVSVSDSTRSTILGSEQRPSVVFFKDRVADIFDAPSGLKWRAILAVTAGICQQSLCWGMIMTFGSILAFYTRHLLPDTSKTAITLVGAIPPFFVLGMSLVWARLLEAGYHRAVNIFAGICLSLGLTGLAFTGDDGDYKDGKYWQILLASILIGIGQSCYFLAAPHTAKSWFLNHKGLAIGITNSGAAIGGTVWPIVFTSVTSACSFRAGIATIAGISTLLSMFIAIFAVPPSTFLHHPVSTPLDIRTWLPTRGFRSRTFLLHISAMCTLYLGILTIPFFLEFWAQQRSLGTSESTTSGTGVTFTSSTTPEPLTVYLVTILNVSQLPSRFLSPILSEKISARKLHAFVCIVAAVIIPPFWLHATTYTHAAIFAAVVGLALGMIVSLPINDIAELLGPDRGHVLGQYAGLMYSLASPFVVGGGVVSGVIVDRGGAWIVAGWATGCFGVCAVLILLSLRIEDDTWKLDDGDVERDRRVGGKMIEKRTEIQSVDDRQV